MKVSASTSATARKIKIIRIGGTGHSGSTMLDLMLSNADNGFSCGEISALLRPFRKHHFKPLCGCHDPGCTLWDQVKAAGENNMWQTLSRLVPEADFFVDSSKESAWLRDQVRLNLEDVFEPLNVLIWKSPADYAYSCMKRGQLRKWKSSYINYHTRYFSMMDRWVSVRYSDLTRDPAGKLRSLCRRLGISFFPGKEIYWNRTYHTLFGSHSAKLHLHERSSTTFDAMVNEHAEHEPTLAGLTTSKRHHKSIYYENGTIEKLPIEVRRVLDNDKTIAAIVRVLEATDVDAEGNDVDIQPLVKELRPVPGWYIYHRAKTEMKFINCKLRGILD